MTDALADALRPIVAELVREELSRRTADAGPRLLTVPEAQRALGGISRPSIYALLNGGRLRSVKLGGRRMVPASAITDLVEGSDADRTVAPGVGARAARTPGRAGTVSR